MDAQNSGPMLELANRYADELTAQFRTLNHFVAHAGEIGRAHETYLRGVISRFLPARLSAGTGFVISQNWASSQQDIIIFNEQDYPVLFRVGDCVVVDHQAVGALIEVKTTLSDTATFLEVLEKLANLYEQVNHRYFVGLFAWEGLDLDTALPGVWSFIRRDVSRNARRLPSAIYIRSRYLLVRNDDGRLETPPLLALGIADGDEGRALLSLISTMWIGGLQHHTTWPWWLNEWWRTIPQTMRAIPWPEDLQQTINEIGSLSS